MALTLDATPKGVNSNSYATRAEADAYFEGRRTADAWTAASGTEKDQALVAATTRLEQESYKSSRTTTDQRLKWPRLWVETDDDYLQYYDAETVPRPVKEACFELALVLLNAGTTDALADTGMEGFDEVSVGPLSVTVNHNFKGGQLPATVVRLLRHVSDSINRTVRLLRS